MEDENSFCIIGEKLYRQGNLHDSAEKYCSALVVKPTSDRAMFAIPAICYSLNRFNLVNSWAARLGNVNKSEYTYQLQAASLLKFSKRFIPARVFSERAICLTPNSVEPWVLHTEILLEKFPESDVKKFCTYSIRLDPRNFRAQFLYATYLSGVESQMESLEMLRDLLAHNRDKSEIYFEISKIYIRQNNCLKAIEALERGICLDPGNFEYCFSLSSYYFLNFDFTRSWREHEKRLFLFYGFLEGPAGGRYLRDCRWLAGLPTRERVVVWADEGVGDELKFGSMLFELVGQVGELIVQLDRRLIPLFRRSLPSKVEFLPREAVIPEHRYDSHIAIGSLGRYLRPNLESFSGRGGKFLYADSHRVAQIRAAVNKLGGERLIGVSWRSSNPENGEARTIRLRDLVMQVRAVNIRLVNLQYGEVGDDIESIENELGVTVWQCPGLDTTEDLDGVAALIEVCDEVISIGNTTAHLAGALGKKTTVILRRAPDWRWLEQHGQSLWYQSVRVVPWSDRVLYD